MNELRLQVRAALDRGFLRRCAEADWLFVSDAPRRVDEPSLATSLRRLEEAGFCTAIADELLRIRPNDALLRQLFADTVSLCFPTAPWQEAPYELARLLLAHPAPWTQQPKPMLLELLKHSDSQQDFAHYAVCALPECAALLRKGLPLPSAGAGWIAKALNSPLD